MKTKNKRNNKVIPFPQHRCPAYPNAADTKYLIDRLVDYALTFATAAGIVSVVFFLMFI